MNRKVIIAGVAVLVVAAGVFAYYKLRSGATAQAQQDPAVQIAVALGALERSETPLTVDQIKIVLPLLRVLRDTDPSDDEASKSLAASIRKVFTPEQLATIDRMRQEFQARRQQGGQTLQGGPRRGPGGPGSGFGPGGPGTSGRASFRAQARQILLGRLIRRLERRLQ